MNNLRKLQESEIEVSIDSRPLTKSDIVKAIHMGVRLAEQTVEFGGGDKSILDRSLARLHDNDNG